MVIKQSVEKSLETFKSHFMREETSIDVANLTEMQINTGNSEPV